MALVAAAATGVQVGAALVATRAVVGELAPGTLALVRYAIGVALLWPAWWWWRQRLPSTSARMPVRDQLIVAALGLLQFALPIVLLNVAVAHIHANLAALLYTTFPLMTLALVTVLGHEAWRPRTALGMLACLAGVAVALVAPLSHDSDASSAAGAARPALGAALALAAALCGAMCSVLYKPYLGRHSALAVGAWAMTASVLGLLPLALWEGGVALLVALSPRGWALVVFVGVSSGVGYLLWLWALANAAATRVTVFLALSPIAAALLGGWLLGEPWTVALGLGLVGVLLGLWLTSGGPDTHAGSGRRQLHR